MSAAHLGVGLATLVIFDEVYSEIVLTRDDIGRAERLIAYLGRFANGGRALAIATDDGTEFRALVEASRVARLPVALEISHIGEVRPDSVDVVALVSRPTKADRTPLLSRLVRAVRSDGLIVQVRDDLTFGMFYRAEHRILEREVRARNNAGSR